MTPDISLPKALVVGLIALIIGALSSGTAVFGFLVGFVFESIAR
jgi:hypothetical protein